MSGGDLMELQRLVTELGYPTPRSGTFTSRTKSDIPNYERTTGLRVNGEIDPSEGKTIVRRAQEHRDRSSGGSTRSYDFGERTLSQGVRGRDVLTLQRLVSGLGYPTPRYGVFTSRTERDMIHYERSTDLQVNGVVSRSEQRAIARRAGQGEPSRGHVFPIRGSHSYGGSGSRFGAPRRGHSYGGQDLAAASGTSTCTCASLRRPGCRRVSASASDSRSVAWARPGAPRARACTSRCGRRTGSTAAIASTRCRPSSTGGRLLVARAVPCPPGDRPAHAGRSPARRLHGAGPSSPAAAASDS